MTRAPFAFRRGAERPYALWAVARRSDSHLEGRPERLHRDVGWSDKAASCREAVAVVGCEGGCRSYDELRNFLRPRIRHNQHVPANRRRRLHLRHATAALAILKVA